jgi:hypothetical protein
LINLFQKPESMEALRTRVRKILIDVHSGEATDAEVLQLAKLLQKSPALAEFARSVVEQQVMLELWASSARC